jgi:phenylalanyl-tRNA synthetase beta chain
MKFTLGWLKEHLESDASLEAIVDKLSMLGLEVEGVEDRAKDLAAFTIAYVKEAKPHPNADRLRVCSVETAEGEVQVVCGAPNARTGMYGVFAPTGSYVPGTGITLKAGVIRGEASNGMLVSEREMGLSDEHDGIIDVTGENGAAPAPLGTPFAEVLGLDDPVIEIAITPNRGDCLSVRGIARDLAAAGLGVLKPLNAPRIAGSFDSPTQWRRELPGERESACPYVAGRSFRGVSNGPSPRWMQDRLRAIGLRPISALVDITNYVTFDLGRPLHVFDADKLAGDPTMRFAREGESILALDGRSYALDPETLVIADDKGPQGIGGIMGGEDTGCDKATRNVFLEVALFDPIMVATTGRRLGILSDARYRFERGLDPESARWGVEVAARLIQDICGGEVSHLVEAGEIPENGHSVTLRAGRVESLGGVAVPLAEQQRILEGLGFEVTAASEGLRCRVPSWRPDIESGLAGESGLVEEVLRVHGYEHLPTATLSLETSLPLPVLSAGQRRVSAARTALAWSGLEEAVTFSFLSERQARLFGWSDETLRLDNPISADLDVMRPSVLPALLAAAGRNAARGFPNVGLFEVGPQYESRTPDGQSLAVAALRTGETGPRHWNAAPRKVDAFDAKADALRVLEAIGAPVDNLQVGDDAPAWYHPGRSGALRLGPNVLAYFGELHPRVLRDADVKGPVAACEVFLERVPAPRAKDGKLKPALDLSPFQPVERDFAFVVDEAVPADKAIRAAKGADRKLVARVDLFDVYRGPGVPEGQKSLALAVTLQPRERTLTDEDLEAISQKIVAQVVRVTGGTLRG